MNMITFDVDFKTVFYLFFDRNLIGCTVSLKFYIRTHNLIFSTNISRF